MSESLSEFLVDLVSNPDQMAAFLADPERVFATTGLTAEERDAVRSRDPRRLSAALTSGLQLQANTNNATAARKGTKKGAKKKGAAKKGGTKKGGRKGGSKR